MEVKNVVGDREYTGGAIASIGFEQQDMAGMIYAFKYLDCENGLEEISFESLNDFYIVLKDNSGISVQVKVNTLTCKFVKSLQSDTKSSCKTVIVGSYMDDEFRNVLQKKDRYLNLAEGKAFDNKDELYKQWKECCDGAGLNSDFVLNTDFDAIGARDNSRVIGVIADWADRQKEIIDIGGLIRDLEVEIKHRRCNAGKLSRDELKDMISGHRTIKVEKNPIPASLEMVCDQIDAIIHNNEYFKNDLLLIRQAIENNHYYQARSHIEDFQKKKVAEAEMAAVYFWVLNKLGLYEETIRQGEKYKDSADWFLCYTMSNASFCSGKSSEAKEWFDKIGSRKDSVEIQLLEACIDIAMEDFDSALAVLEENVEGPNKIQALLLKGEIYTSLHNWENARKNFDLLLSIDENNADANYSMGYIYEAHDDYENALYYYKRYAECSESEMFPHEIMLKIASFSYICKKKDYITYYQKWNNLFRKQEKIQGEVGVANPVVGKDKTYMFLVQSLPNGYRAYCDDVEIGEFIKGENEARSGFGLVISEKDINDYCAAHHIEESTLSDELKKRKIAHPYILRLFEDYDTYSQALERIRLTGKLTLIGIYNENIVAFEVDSNDIKVDLKVTKTDVTGIFTIGDVDMNIWVGDLSQGGFEAFRKQLTRDYWSNKVGFHIKYDDEHYIKIFFDKSCVKITDL